MFTNRYSFKQVLQANINQYEDARLMQRERAMLLKEKIDFVNRQKEFRLTDDNLAEYLSLNDPHWVALMSVLKEEVKTPRCDTEGDETVVGHSE